MIIRSNYLGNLKKTKLTKKILQLIKVLCVFHTCVNKYGSKYYIAITIFLHTQITFRRRLL